MAFALPEKVINQRLPDVVSGSHCRLQSGSVVAAHIRAGIEVISANLKKQVVESISQYRIDYENENWTDTLFCVLDDLL